MLFGADGTASVLTLADLANDQKYSPNPIYPIYHESFIIRYQIRALYQVDLAGTLMKQPGKGYE